MLFVDHHLLFGSLTNLFIVGWLALFVGMFFGETSPNRRRLLWIGGRLTPVILLVLFVVGFAFTRNLPGGMTSLDAVLLSFSVPEKAMLAWFEVIGLALLVGRWIIDEQKKANIPLAVTALCLVGTFFAAAIGVVLHLCLGLLFRKRAVGSA